MPSVWMSTNNPCDWTPRISCGDARVSLNGLSLKGELNFSIPWPRGLKTISVNFNSLNNSFTNVDLSVLPNTTEFLFFHSNDFSGTEKKKKKNGKTKVTRFEFYEKHVSILFCILDWCTMSHMKSLRMIWFYSNALSGSINFTCFQSLPNLFSLSIGGNDFSGSYGNFSFERI